MRGILFDLPCAAMLPHSVDTSEMHHLGGTGSWVYSIAFPVPVVEAAVVGAFCNVVGVLVR